VNRSSVHVKLNWLVPHVKLFWLSLSVKFSLFTASRSLIAEPWGHALNELNLGEAAGLRANREVLAKLKEFLITVFLHVVALKPKPHILVVDLSFLFEDHVKSLR
jgi:hypothetical protein